MTADRPILARLLAQLQLPHADGTTLDMTTTARNRKGAASQRAARAEAAGSVSAMASHAAWSKYHGKDGA